MDENKCLEHGDRELKFCEICVDEIIKRRKLREVPCPHGCGRDHRFEPSQNGDASKELEKEQSL